MAYGTLSTLDSLAAIRQSVAEFGEDRAWDSIAVALEAQNRFVQDITGTLMERTTDQQRAYGSGDTKSFEELDQFGAPSAQKVTAGITVGFPLRRYGNALQWTRQFFETMEVSQLAAEVNAIMAADYANIVRAAKLALFTSTSNTSYVDYLGKPAGVTLALRALVNNDGLALPVGPNGEVFATSHTHYLANATLTAAVLTNLVVTIQEHFNTGTPILVISQTDEAAVRALTGFVADVDVRIVQPNTATYTNNPGGVDVANLYDRRIGLFGAAEVWIKPWAIANYVLGYMQGVGQPPLVMRVPPFAGAGDLRLIAEDERHPLRARTYERQMGIGVWNRVAAGVLYFAGGSYVVPTIV